MVGLSGKPDLRYSRYRGDSSFKCVNTRPVIVQGVSKNIHIVLKMIISKLLKKLTIGARMKAEEIRNLKTYEGWELRHALV